MHIKYLLNIKIAKITHCLNPLLKVFKIIYKYFFYPYLGITLLLIMWLTSCQIKKNIYKTETNQNCY